jgi:4-hydroxy-2-oxoheptanedioate aldolase
MRKSKIRQKLDSGQVARVCALGANLPYYPRMAAQFGYDAVWVDGEHRAWDPRELTALIAHHHLADIDCLYRPPTTEKTGLSRLLEDGVAALMIPQVNNEEQARQLVQSTKFPPLGERGLDGSGLDGGYTLTKTPDYPSQRNHETVLILQIETPEGLENLDAILAVPGMDALLLGPGDLSLRLDCTPSIRDPKIRAAVERLAARIFGQQSGGRTDSCRSRLSDFGDGK